MTTALSTTTNLGIDPFRAIEQANLRPSTKAQYRRALQKYLEAGNRLTDTEALVSYASKLKQSARAFLKAALKLWSERVKILLKGQATPDNVAAIQASIYRLEALNETIEVKQTVSQKTQVWLTSKEVARLDSLYRKDSLKHKRNRLALGLMVGAGLRRTELVNLKFSDVHLEPIKDSYRAILNVFGKGAKNRKVPISTRLFDAIRSWQEEIEGEDDSFILRSLNNGSMGDSITSAAIYSLCRNTGARLAKDKKNKGRAKALEGLAPHSLRRTYAQLGFEAGIPITQISRLLGHSNVATTQRYLDLSLDRETTISDFIPVFAN